MPPQTGDACVRDADRKLIRELALFREMSDDNFELLMNAAFLQRFPERVLLIHEGDLPDFLHIVIEGTVEWFASGEGRQTTLDVIGPVTTFILAAVIRDEVYLKSARTLTPAQILMIPAPAVRQVFDRDGAFARAVVAELAQRYRDLVRALKNQKLRSGAERLANWILQADHRQGNGGRVRLTYDKRTLASHLGMTAENLSRSLMSLAEHGVESHGREIVITDPAALTRCAKPNALIDG
jgi:CRP/FNR family transcriptional regulator, transcriptional activator FtrB